MRPLSAALQAAATAGTAAPEVRLELIDATPHYAPVYTGGPTGRNSALLAADGAVVQAYHDGAHTVYVRRVIDPTQAVWGAWSTATTGAAATTAPALVRLSDRLRLLWQDAATTAVYAADSFDGGASWGAATALFDPGAAVAGLAADGDATTLFVAYAAGAAWRVAAWTLGTTWTGADWTNGDAVAITGLGAVRNGDGSYLVAATRQEGTTTGAAVQVCTYAATWNPLVTVVPADLGAGVALADPRLSFYDGRYHLAYALVDSGTVSGLVSARVALAHSLDGVHWSDPLEDAATYAHGAVALQHAAGYLLVAPDAAALAPLYTASAAQYRDCTADVSRLEVIQKDGAPARLVVTLQNDAGQYDGLAALRPNARLRLALGYAGAGMAPAYVCYVDDWSLLRAADENEVVVTASDALAWLERQSRTTLLYSEQTVDWLAREILARAGLLAVTLPATEQFAQAVPSFAIPVGTSWRDALVRLSRLYGFDVAARAQPDGSDAVALVEKNPADAPAWSYGGEVEELVLARVGDRANHVLVFGAPATGGPPMGEGWDWADVEDTGQERYLHVIEPMITTAAGAGIRAALELQQEARRERLARGGAAPRAGIMGRYHPGRQTPAGHGARRHPAPRLRAAPRHV